MHIWVHLIANFYGPLVLWYNIEHLPPQITENDFSTSLEY